jgi:hypothetical protein
VKREWRGSYRGQKQIWYLLRLVGRDTDVSLRASERPEFDAWRWHDYWVPLDSVIEFKREVYRRALTELERFCALRRLAAVSTASRIRRCPRPTPIRRGRTGDPCAAGYLCPSQFLPAAQAEERVAQGRCRKQSRRLGGFPC